MLINCATDYISFEFRKYIASEKENMEGAPSTMITVERNRLLDDGYRQLSLLSPTALKATIRVKFINQQVRCGPYYDNTPFGFPFL